MALFDGIVAGVARQFGLGDKARSLIGWLLSLITSSKVGGLSGFLDHMRHAGLGSLVQDMMGTGEKAPLSSNQVESLFGRNALSSIASKLGIGETLATSAVATALPNLIGALTPNGVVPDRLPAEAESFMRDASQAVGAAGHHVAAAGRQAVGAAQQAASSANVWLWSLLPLLGLGLLVVFLVRSCTPSVTTTTTTRPEDTRRGSERTVPVPDVTKLSTDLTGDFTSLTDTLTSIKDAASAQAALPKLKDLDSKLDSVRALVDKLPQAGKTKITALVRPFLSKLGDQFAKLQWIPGVSDKVRQPMNEIMGKLADLGGVEVPKAPQLSGDLANAFASLTETLTGVKDVATAEAALPKLRDISGSLDGAKAAMDKLSGDSKAVLRALIESSMTKLKELADKVLAIAGVGDKIKPVVEAIMNKLTTLAG
jgi:uncharacterized protein YidB (DUF937 family)